MTALLETIKRAGVTVEVVGGKLKARGPQDAVNRLLPVLKERKPELLRLLAAQRPKAVEPELQPVLRWLLYIGETDKAVIAEVLQRCRDGAEALAYFLGRSREVPTPESDAAADDPMSCNACRHFQRDAINPAQGIGACGTDVGQHGPALWPMARRYCGRFEA